MPPRHWASLGFAAIAAVCLTPGVFAAPLPPPPPPLDDHPAPPPPPATKAEAEARARRMFAAVDADHDGYVTRAEADAGRQRLRMMMMARRPGAGRADGFDRLDTDRDGNISRAEFAARRPGPAAGAAGAVDISGGRERVSRELPPPPRPGRRRPVTGRCRRRHRRLRLTMVAMQA